MRTPASSKCRSAARGLRPSALALAAGLPLLLLPLVLVGCVHDARHYPGPLESEITPLPPGVGTLIERGPEEVLIARHSDPVHVRPAGTNGAYPLTFYNKRVRVNSGSAVVVAAGGRAEVLWPNGTSIVLSDETVGLIGSPSRGEPIFIFGVVDHARLELVPGDEVQLMGGSILTGESGPYVIDRRYADIMRVHNQSKGPLEIAYRDALFELGPGHSVDLPLIEVGTVPVDNVGFRRLAGTGYDVGVRGTAQTLQEEGGIRVRATEPSEVDALGVRLRLAAGEEVFLDGLTPAGTPNLIPE